MIEPPRQNDRRPFVASLSSAKQPRNTVIRIGVWFASVVLAAAVFAAVFGINSPLRDVFAIFEVTIMFSVIGALIYLPVVVAFKNAQGVRIGVMVGLGLLIGPLAFALFMQIQYLRGFKGGSDPEVPPNAFFYLCAAAVGFLSSAIYGLALRILNRTPQQS